MREKISKDPLALVSGIYIFMVLAVFPLFFRDYYFDIVDVKYQFYWITSLAFIACCLISIAWRTIRCRDAGKHWARIWSFMKNWRTSFPVWMLLLFWMNCIISTIQSEYLYESFWGNEGRYTGLFLISIYVWTTILLFLYAGLKRWYLDVSVAVTGIVGTIGICDYFGIDVLGFQKASELVPNKNEFMSTIGNVNFYTAFLSLGVAAAVVLFVMEKLIWRRIIYLIFTVLGYASMILGQSDSVYITLGCLFLLLPFFCMREVRNIERILFQAALFMSILSFIIWLNSHYKKVIETINIFDVLGAYSSAIIMLVIVLWGMTILAVLLRLWIEKKQTLNLDILMKRCRMVWGIVLILVIGTIILIILDANFGSDPNKYGKFKFFLVYTDQWGSSRGMVWRIGISSWLKQPLIHKLFGYGPETFGILTWEYRVETVTASHSIFDSMHNEYLQNLVTMGPIGMLSYMALLGSTIIVVVRKAKEKTWLYAIAIAIACYGAQAMVNISMPIVAPVLWIYLGIGLAAVRRMEYGEEDKEQQ